MLLIIGSRRIFSLCCSCASSQEWAVISSPFFVRTVILLSRSLVAGLSCVCSGRAGPLVSAAVRWCFGRLPSAGVSATVRFACCGDGSAGRVWQLVGDVAIGAIGASAIAGGNFGIAGCADPVAGSKCASCSSSSASVCVAVASPVLFIGLKTIGPCPSAGPAVVNLFSCDCH